MYSIAIANNDISAMHSGNVYPLCCDKVISSAIAIPTNSCQIPLETCRRSHNYKVVTVKCHLDTTCCLYLDIPTAFQNFKVSRFSCHRQMYPQPIDLKRDTKTHIHKNIYHSSI